MVIVDKAGQIQLVNAQTEKVFGYSREELVGDATSNCSCHAAFTSATFGIAKHTRNRLTQEPWAWDWNSSAAGKSGSEFPVEIASAPANERGHAHFKRDSRRQLRRRTEERNPETQCRIKRQDHRTQPGQPRTGILQLLGFARSARPFAAHRRFRADSERRTCRQNDSREARAISTAS